MFYSSFPGWETINYTLDNTTMSDYITPYRGTLKQLLIDFFKFYADFNYSTDVTISLTHCMIPFDTIFLGCLSSFGRHDPQEQFSHPSNGRLAPAGDAELRFEVKNRKGA